MNTKNAIIVAVLMSLLGPVASRPVKAQAFNEGVLPDPLSMQLPGASKPGADPLSLLQSPQVRQELSLTEGQMQQLQKLDKETRLKVRSLSAVRTRGGSSAPSVSAVRGFETAQQDAAMNARQKVAEILNPQQLEAFKGLVQASPGVDPLQLLLSDGVRSRLGLNAAQSQQLRQLAAQGGGPREGRTRGSGTTADSIATLSRQLEGLTRSLRSTVASILTPEQLSRFRQIIVQVDAAALADPAMADALNLTPKQQQTLALDRQRTFDAIGDGHKIPRTRGDSGEVPCGALQANRTRLDPVLQQSQARSRGQLSSSQLLVLQQMEGKPLALTPPASCRP